MTDRRTILCIGTTGMLSGMTRSLIESGASVHVISRTERSLDRLRWELGPSDRSQLIPHQCDYADPTEWGELLDQLPKSIDTVICWIHSTAPKAFDQLLDCFEEVDILRVASSSTDPDDAHSDSYRTVILGSIREHGNTRWLTHEEISKGVLHAFESLDRVSVVGVLPN